MRRVRDRRRRHAPRGDDVDRDRHPPRLRRDRRRRAHRRPGARAPVRRLAGRRDARADRDRRVVGDVGDRPVRRVGRRQPPSRLLRRVRRGRRARASRGPPLVGGARRDHAERGPHLGVRAHDEGAARGAEPGRDLRPAARAVRLLELRRARRRDGPARPALARIAPDGARRAERARCAGRDALRRDDPPAPTRAGSLLAARDRRGAVVRDRAAATARRRGARPRRGRAAPWWRSGPSARPASATTASRWRRARRPAYELGVALAVVLLVVLALSLAITFCGRPSSRRTRRRAARRARSSSSCSRSRRSRSSRPSRCPTAGSAAPISNTWRTLTDPSASPPPNDPGRLTAAGSVRARYWNESLKAFRDHLWRGVGAGGYATVRPRYRQDEIDVRHAHGYVMQVAADLGIIGLAASLALLASWLASALSATGLRPSRPRHAVHPGAERARDACSRSS